MLNMHLAVSVACVCYSIFYRHRRHLLLRTRGFWLRNGCSVQNTEQSVPKDNWPLIRRYANLLA